MLRMFLPKIIKMEYLLSRVLQELFIILTLEGLLENHLVHALPGPGGISHASTFLLYSGLFPIRIGTVYLLVTEAVLIGY